MNRVSLATFRRPLAPRDVLWFEGQRTLGLAEVPWLAVSWQIEIVSSGTVRSWQEPAQAPAPRVLT